MAMPLYRPRGFTLIELMIVVIIIAALAGMVAPRLVGRSDDAKAKIAQADIANLSTAIKLFRLDNDRFPSTSEGVAALLQRPANAPGWKEPYIEGPALDPWKRAFKYTYPGGRGKSGFDLYSTGPDGEAGNADDIGNW